jgi:hypothetical protein
MADHYFQYCRRHHPSKITSFRTLDEYRNHVSDHTEGAFTDIRFVAEAYKHLYLRNPNASIASTGAIESIPISGSDVERIFQDVANDSPSRGVVRYSTKTGQRYDFYKRLQKVIEYWEAEIEHLQNNP